MADTRSRIEKLRAMAADDSSPHEAAIARERLAALGAPVKPPPPPPPTRNAAPGVPDPFAARTSSTGVFNADFTVRFTVRDPFS